MEVNGHSLLLGLSAHPIDAIRANLDLELFSGDRAVTRISPRNLQHYKARISYKPGPWMNLGGTVNVLESRNNETDVSIVSTTATTVLRLCSIPSRGWA